MAKIQQGGKDVLNLGQATDGTRLSKPAFGPTDKAGHAVAALPDLGFLTSHSGIEILGPKQASVVRLEDQYGVVRQTLVVEELHELTHIPIDVADHPKVKAEPIFQATVQMVELGIGENFGNRLAVLILGPEGTMWSIGGKIAQERFFLLNRFANEALRLVEKDIGAIALELFFLPVMHVNIIKVIVPPISGNGRDG